MKNVMWKGQLYGTIKLDTISNKKGLYGIGPLSYLKGEILINDGVTYVSKALSESQMSVEKTFEVDAPFLVYGNVNKWNELKLPEEVVDIKTLEVFIDQNTKRFKRPFIFKLKGNVETAEFHIQDLPEGTKVSSPKEGHIGQKQYTLTNEPVELIGFFSTEHHGVFTHHDSNVHIHLLTKDEKKMGHLDAVKFNNREISLFLPKK